MSVATVARTDFLSVRRSYAVVGVVAMFAVIVALVFLGSSDVHSHPVRTTWGFSALVVLTGCECTSLDPRNASATITANVATTPTTA